MTAKDFRMFALWGALPLALLAPAWFSLHAALASFGDLYSYHYPMRHLALSGLQAGRLPFWNPYIFGGVPLAANPQAALFYPVTLLGGFFPLSLAFSWDYLFHLLWGGLGLFILGRRERLTGAAALLVATAFILSPFALYRITEGIPTLLASLAWAPWCWLALGCGRPGLLAACWSLQFFSGHPQFMLINAVGMGLWCAARRRDLLRGLATESALAGLLAAAQWLPTFEFMKHSVRAAWSGAFNTAYSIDWATLATWVLPDAWGNPMAGTWADVPSVFFETAGVHVGVLGLGLALLGLARPRSWPILLLVAAGLFFSFGGNNPLYRALVEKTPLGFLRTPSRWLLLSLWGLAVAMGAALKRYDRRLPRWATAAALAVCALELCWWGRTFIRTEHDGKYLAVNPSFAAAAGGQALRVMTDPEMASANKAMLYRAMNMNGYEAFYLGSFPGFAARSEGAAAADPSRSYLRRHDTPLMSRAGVRYFLSLDGVLSENKNAQALASREDSKGGLSVAIERPESWRIAGVEGGARVILAQPFFPGWTAWSDGRKLQTRPWEGFLQAVDIPSGLGRGELRLSFVPSGWPLWVSLSALSWLAWLSRAAAR